MDPALIQAGWGAMILDERRSILDIFVANITVMPAKAGAKVFDLLGSISSGDRYQIHLFGTR